MIRVISPTTHTPPTATCIHLEVRDYKHPLCVVCMSDQTTYRIDQPVAGLQADPSYQLHAVNGRRRKIEYYCLQLMSEGQVLWMILVAIKLFSAFKNHCGRARAFCRAKKKRIKKKRNSYSLCERGWRMNARTDRQTKCQQAPLRTTSKDRMKSIPLVWSVPWPDACPGGIDGYVVYREQTRDGNTRPLRSDLNRVQRWLSAGHGGTGTRGQVPPQVPHRWSSDQSCATVLDCICSSYFFIPLSPSNAESAYIIHLLPQLLVRFHVWTRMYFPQSLSKETDFWVFVYDRTWRTSILFGVRPGRLLPLTLIQPCCYHLIICGFISIKTYSFEVN